MFTSLWDAASGRNTGSQVNVISQSGANLVHGSAYGFFNHQALNARDFFDYSAAGSSGFPLEARTFSRITGAGDCQPGGVQTTDGCSYTASLLNGVTGARAPIIQPNPSEGENPFRRLQGGFTLGGPFSKKFFGPLGHSGENRTFFFTSFERQDIKARQETHFSVPTVADRGFLGSGASGFRIPGLTTLRVSDGCAAKSKWQLSGTESEQPDRRVSGRCAADHPTDFHRRRFGLLALSFPEQSGRALRREHLHAGPARERRGDGLLLQARSQLQAVWRKSSVNIHRALQLHE